MKFLCYTYVKSVCFFIQRSFLCYLVFILQRKRTEPFTIAAALLIAASTSASEAFRPKKMPIVPIVVLQKLAANLFLWKNHWPLPTIFLLRKLFPWQISVTTACIFRHQFIYIKITSATISICTTN